MNSFLQADIFFFITSVAIVVVTIALLIAFVFAIQILRDVRHVSRRLREESDQIFSDVEDLRKFVKKEGKKAIDIKDLVSGVVGTFLPRKKSRRRKKDETSK